jgi:hypothetical protein
MPACRALVPPFSRLLKNPVGSPLSGESQESYGFPGRTESNKNTEKPCRIFLFSGRDAVMLPFR